MQVEKLHFILILEPFLPWVSLSEVVTYAHKQKGSQTAERQEGKERKERCSQGRKGNSLSTSSTGANTACASLPQIQLYFLGQWFATFAGLQSANNALGSSQQYRMSLRATCCPWVMRGLGITTLHTHTSLPNKPST